MNTAYKKICVLIYIFIALGILSLMLAAVSSSLYFAGNEKFRTSLLFTVVFSLICFSAAMYLLDRIRNIMFNYPVKKIQLRCKDAKDFYIKTEPVFSKEYDKKDFLIEDGTIMHVFTRNFTDGIDSILILTAADCNEKTIKSANTKYCEIISEISKNQKLFTTVLLCADKKPGSIKTCAVQNQLQMFNSRLVCIADFNEFTLTYEIPFCNLKKGIDSTYLAEYWLLKLIREADVA